MSLFCIVLVDPLTSPFAVDIAEKNLIDNIEISIDNLTIGHLKKLIWKRKQRALVDIKPNQLTLWKVEGLNEGNRKWEILEKKVHTEIDIKQEFGGEKLFSTVKFKEAFPEKLPDNVVHVIVQLPRKRSHDDSEEKGIGQESKKVKLLATASKIMESIMKLPDICNVYSSPKNFLSLPFPYPGSNIPVDRFAINEDGFFTFMGRKEFINILNEINTFKARTGYMEMFIYGTVGYGTSHILAAIACFLLRNGRRVVYLPDCRKLLAVDAMEYIKSVLFLTYVDDDTKTNKINACESFDQIIKFCRSLDETLYFIVDQMNILDDCNNTGMNLVKENIDKLCWKHFYIKNFSANNHAILHLKQKQTNEKKLRFIEDSMSHVKLMSSFLTKGYPPSGYGVSDFDHRFFYIENELCHYVCGVARDCMANYLYEKKRMEIFTDIKWINCIEKFKNNPSVKGFFAEKACIASIFRNGITITLDKSSHSNSEEIFFSSIWPNLKSTLSGYEDGLEIIFIWITSKSDADEIVEINSRKIRNKTLEINPDYSRVVIGFGNIDKDIDRYLS
ncbi:hypothetical protein C2G38_2032125 [Gigaspora rosea]|uniref:Crinkler effector protein N-terminal domain-containing protein n=1 Tax=Gigaspora rosea TaxID=44941 RepID=A0A397VNN7_9GLOM|nr:hypothetical protein C2G38_2032125 [Gigaspora rosea]